ncbi:hypothetical protein ACQ3G6_08730 [Allorhizobium undicola]|uniref:hypothetical protein n=1 Tax=Allorhizobium undicola TaxID=78527 RepID=UPI003D353504
MISMVIVGAILPAVFMAAAWLLNWSLTPGGSDPTVGDVWTMIGGLLGYWGVLFSGYAAYQVKALSEKYFARTRFPQIKENIDAITERMGKAADKPASALRSERFIASISVTLGEVERVPGHKMNELIKRAKAERKAVVDWINDETQNSVNANSKKIYWTLFQTLQEISQEITAHIKEQGAK